MTRRNFTEVETYTNSLLPDNGAGDISAADIRMSFAAMNAKIRQEISASDNIYNPKEYGAVGGARFSLTGGSYDTATNTFSAVDEAGVAIDFEAEGFRVGDTLGYGGNENTIASFDANGNIVTATTMTVNNVLWYVGKDDTAAIQACIDAATANPTGGTVLIDDIYMIANKNSGKAGALIINKTKNKVPFCIMGSTPNQFQQGFIYGWSNHGHAITHTGSFRTFTFADFFIEGVGFSKGGGIRGGGIHVDNNTAGSDSDSRWFNIAVNRMNGNGFYYSGRGEHHIIHCYSGGNGFNGITLKDTFDNKVYHNTCSANGHSGIRIDGSPSTVILGGKMFYNGSNADASPDQNAQIAIIGDQWRKGDVQVVGVNCQEGIIGIYTNVGYCSFTDIQLQGCGRQPIKWYSNLPTHVAAVYLDGGEARMNTFKNVRVSGFSMYEDQNADNGNEFYYWGNMTDIVYLGGSVTTGLGGDAVSRMYGCQANFGEIFYTGQSVDADFNLDFGTSLENSYLNKEQSGSPVVPIGGDAAVIALNSNLNVTSLV